MKPIRLTALALTLTALVGCSRHAVDVQPVGESYFPLAVGNRWVFQSETYDAATMPGLARRDTVAVTAKALHDGAAYYLVEATWPGFHPAGLWVHRADNGNLLWSKSPGMSEGTLLNFGAEVGQRWPLGEDFDACLKSLALIDDYAVVNTPVGRFDGTREIGGGWIDCTDVGWTADFARGVGPVRWEAITIAGPTNWLLVDARIRDEHREPVVDGQ